MVEGLPQDHNYPLDCGAVAWLGVQALPCQHVKALHYGFWTETIVIEDFLAQSVEVTAIRHHFSY